MTALTDVRTSIGAALSPTPAQAAPTSGKTAAENAKIDKSAKDFEAILLSNWLQQAEESFAKVPGGDDDDEDGATAQFTQMSMQSLGASFASTGGIGIAKMISTQLHKTEGSADPASGAKPQGMSSLQAPVTILPPALNNAKEWPIR